MEAGAVPRLPEAFVRPAVSEIVPYEPGKPADEVRRELGLARVVKLASNEGPFPPFPAALEALERGAAALNRYPDGGSYLLRRALAERHGIGAEHVIPAAGADGVVALLSLAALDPGDEVVCGWPSFPSYVHGALRQAALCQRVPLADDRYDLPAMLERIGPRTKIAYVCNPNNPTGRIVTREALDDWFESVPPHVLTVLDEAYFEYVDHPEYVDGIERYLKNGRSCLVLRTFSKIYGLAGLRVGYGVGPAELVTALRKVQNAFDVTQPGQDAALASIGNEGEIERRRSANREGLDILTTGLADLAVRTAPEPVGNFVYVELGQDARPVFDALLREGVIVRPLHGFGDPQAIRVSVGTREECRLALEALGRVLGRA